MKRIAFLLLSLLWLSTSVLAQPHDKDHKGRHDRIRALKIAFVTERVALTPAQAEKFWPIYNQYDKELWDIRRSFFQKYKDQNKDLDPETARRYVEDNLDYQEQTLDLKKQYKSKLLKVISAQQLADLYQSERDFKKMLIEQLSKRRDARKPH